MTKNNLKIVKSSKINEPLLNVIVYSVFEFPYIS